MNPFTRSMAPLRNVAQGKFFYGWVIVVVAFLGNFMSAGPGGYTIGLYYRPLHEDLGWDRSTVTVAISLAGIVSGISGPFVGWALDRFGARPVMVVGALIGSVGITGIAWVQEPWHFYLLYGVVGALGIAEFGNVANSVALAKWFVRKRGRAIALATMGFSAGGFLLIPLTSFMISHFGWRLSWVLMGLLIFLTVTLPTWRFMRSRPEDLDLLPDGKSLPEAQLRETDTTAKATHVALELSWTMREAVKTRAFWLLILTFNFGSMAAGALIIHQIPYMEDKGFVGQAAAVASLVAFVHLIVKPFWGFLVERVHPRYCIMLSFAAAAAGVVALRLADTLPLLYLFAVLFGAGNGAFGVLVAVTWADYYGRESLGAIRGVAMPFNIAVGAGTPLFAAWVADTYHSYDVVMYVFMMAYVLGIASMYLARQPLHHSERSVREAIVS